MCNAMSRIWEDAAGLKQMTYREWKTHHPVYGELLLLASTEKGMAWLLRCKTRLRAKSRNSERLPLVRADSLDPSELQLAETAIIRLVQQKYFKELKAPKSGKSVVKKNPIYILELFSDEERILQVGGRLKNAPLLEMARHPYHFAQESSRVRTCCKTSSRISEWTSWKGVNNGVRGVLKA